MPELVSFAFDLKGTEKSAKKVARYTLKKAPVLFRAGDYPDKGFKLTEEELIESVKNFNKPVKMDWEHKGSIFDGKMGDLVRVEKNADASFSGYFAVPDWFEAIVPEDEQKVSIQFDKATKNIVGCAWTSNPRISEAKLVASFMDDDKTNGQLPEVQDATPTPQADATEESDAEGTALFEKIKSLLTAAKSKANAKVHSKSYLRSLDDMLEECDEYLGGEGEDDEDDGSDEDKANMSKTKKEETVTTQTVNFSKDRSSAAALREFNNLVRDRRLLPRQKDTFIASYVKFDETDTVAFSNGKTADNLDTFLKSMWDNQQHSLTEEQLKQQDGVKVIDAASFSKDKTDENKPISEERRKELLGATRTGREILNGQSKK